jgi:hypothetical protein
VNVQFISNIFLVLSFFSWCAPLQPHIHDPFIGTVSETKVNLKRTPKTRAMVVDVQPPSEADLERNRSKLQILYHAATCPCEDLRYGNNVCTHMVHCCAAKRLFQHIITCTQTDCDVPGCRHSRSVWKHYRKCRQSTSCGVCSAVPHLYTSKALCRRFRTVVKAFPKSGGGSFGIGDDTTDEGSTSTLGRSRGVEDATTANNTGVGVHLTRDRIWQDRLFFASVSASTSHDTASSMSVVVHHDNEKENNADAASWTGRDAFLFPFPATGGQHQTAKSGGGIPIPESSSRSRRGAVVTATGTPERDPAKKTAWPELPAHPRDAPRLYRVRRPNKNWSII